MTGVDQDRTVMLTVDEGDLLAEGRLITSDRRARLFFRGSLGATEIVGGWRCPRRRLAIYALTVRVHDWLERHAYVVERSGAADRMMSLELERRQSIIRTAE